MKEIIVGGILNKSTMIPFTLENIALFKNKKIDVYLRKDIDLYEGYPNGSEVFFAEEMLVFVGKRLDTLNTNIILDSYYNEHNPTINFKRWSWQFDWLEFKLS